MLLNDEPRIDVNFTGMGQTALSKCVLKAKNTSENAEEYLSCVRLLLEHRADVNIVDVYSATALHYSADAVNIPTIHLCFSHFYST